MSKIYQLNIIKKLNKDYKSKKSWKTSNREYGLEHQKSLSEDEKSKLVEYRKKYYRMRKMALI